MGPRARSGCSCWSSRSPPRSRSRGCCRGCCRRCRPWPMAILRWLLIALASTAVMVAFDRLTRRLLPLAVLLGLTLAFPDQAPSRFKIALRIGTTLQLRRIIADARAGRIGETPAEAAEKLLELVGALSVHDRAHPRATRSASAPTPTWSARSSRSPAPSSTTSDGRHCCTTSASCSCPPRSSTSRAS